MRWSLSPDNPHGPYPNTAIGITPSAADGVRLLPSANNFNVDGTDGNDCAQIGTATEILLGRLVIDNALGGGPATPPVPTRTQ